jgi:hypothetical protein
MSVRIGTNPMSSGAAGIEGSATARGWARWAPLTGIAFVLLFIGSFVASNPPADSASDKQWLANYAGRANQVSHFTTGILLVLAALCLMSFLTILWTRIAATRRPEMTGPLPLVAAGVSAACIAVGGVLQAGISGSRLVGSSAVSGADLLRFGNDLGFGMVAVGGMLAASLSIACLSVQAYSVGLFGRRLMVFGLVVSVVLLGSLAFIPIAALFIWIIVVAVTLLRSRPLSVRSPQSEKAQVGHA